MITITPTTMKRLFITICTALAIMCGGSMAAQQPTKADTTQVTTTQAKAIKPGKPTPHTYKGYPVYQGAKGGYFVIRTSQKTGKQYKQYIKPEKFDK